MNTPIGVIDSGVGGLAVLRHIHDLAPGLGTLYVADRRYLPYGDHTADFVAERAATLTRRLIEVGAEVVVLACNTASAAALIDLRATFTDTRFVGMEPAVKPAAELTNTGVVGVLATAGTLDGELMARVEANHANGTLIERRVGERLASAVEFGTETSDEVRRLLLEHVEAFRAADADTVVLGCTHYSFLSEQLRMLTSGAVQIVDPSEAVALRTVSVASELALSRSGERHYVTTTDPGGLAQRIDALIGASVEVTEVDW